MVRVGEEVAAAVEASRGDQAQGVAGSLETGGVEGGEEGERVDAVEGAGAVVSREELHREEVVGGRDRAVRPESTSMGRAARAISGSMPEEAKGRHDDPPLVGRAGGMGPDRRRA